MAVSGKVLEHEAHLVAVVLEHVFSSVGVDARAERALEVRVLDDGHLRVPWAALGLVVERDLAHGLLERIDGQVRQVAAEGVVPVGRHVKAMFWLCCPSEATMVPLRQPASRVLELDDLEGDAGAETLFW